MPPPATSADVASAPRARPLVWLGWIAILGGMAWFIFDRIPRYLVFTPESYGEYFWSRIGWLVPHIAGGILAAILGPLQFWPKIRRDYLPFHRIAGRLYVAAVLVGSIASLGMSTRIDPSDTVYACGLIGLAVAWLSTTGMAFVAIRRKNLVQHKQWMIRSYVVTFAFVTFRLVEDLLKAGNVMSGHEAAALLAWGSWAVPLLFTEVILQSTEVFRKRPAAT